MNSLISDLSQQFDEFMRSEGDPLVRLSKGKILLQDIRAAGVYLSDLVERENYAQMARDISDVIFEIEGVLPPARLAAIAIDTTKGQGRIFRDTKELLSIIQPITLMELRERYGKYWSRVNWIDRGAIGTSELRAHGLIVITGRMKIGKTREAFELIQRAIKDEQVSENCLFEPGSAFRFFSREKLQEVLQGIDPRAPILLFLDDFPRHYTGKALERLSDLLLALKARQSVLVVATARLDQITDEHRTWLTNRKFYEVKLPDLTTEQTSRLLDNASEIYSLQINDQARDKFLEKRDGTPELTLMGLRKLYLQGASQITDEVARQVTSESLVDAWAGTRHYIIGNYPLAEYLFESLATFYSTGVTSYVCLVVAYAKHLGERQNRWGFMMRASTIKDTLAYLSNFDIVERERKIFAPDIVVEKQVSDDDALENLADFLLHYHSLYRSSALRWLYRDAQAHALALFDLGGIYFSKENYSLAKNAYFASIGFYNYAEVYNNRGNTYAKLDDYPAALADYAKAIELNPQYAMAYNNRGNTHDNLQNYPAALADFTKTIELDSQYADAYYNRGNIYAKLQNYPAALADYVKAIELNPQFAETYNNRGNTYYKLQDHLAALADYTKAIELNPQYAMAYNNRGSSYAELHNYPAALADYFKAIELNPQYVEAYNNRGNIYEKLQNHPAALGDYVRAIELNPQDAEAYYNCGNTYAILQDYPAALADYTKAIELNLELSQAYSRRGFTHYYLHDYPAALADLSKAIELDPQDAEAYYNRGAVYANLQDYSATLADFTKAIELNPQYVEAYYNRGNTYAILQDYLAALADYTKAIELDPQGAKAHYNIASVFALQSQSEDACRWLMQAIRLDSKYFGLAQTDSDFDPVRGTPEFQALFKEFE